MDWARDWLGRDVLASQCETSYGLSCPTCGERVVFRRAGKNKRPHFAHYSHSAKPECENYHPSSNINVLPASGPLLPTKDSSSSNPSLTRGIFLYYTESEGYSLYLKLPHFSAEKESYGELSVRTGFGIRTYTTSQLLQSRLVPVIPKLPLAEVTASRSLSLSKTEADIKACIRQFRSFGNYFKASEYGSRLLGIEEPLEWGEHYYLLTQQQLKSVPAIFGLKIKIIECWKSWNLYDIVLPSFSDTTGEFERKTLTIFLSRVIKAPYTHAYFITPPHHIEPDGTYVFPENTKNIVIRRTAPGHISVRENRQAIISDIDEEWIEITELETGCFTILVDGREELLGKIEGCVLFQPKGVRVVFDGVNRELFEPELKLVLQNKVFENLRIECPSLRVANLLNLEQNAWTREEQSFIYSNTECHFVDAMNFGILAWASDDETITSKSTEISAEALTRRIWLEGIVARFYGPEVLLNFRNELNSISTSGYSALTLRKLAWLSPHIALIKRGVR